MAVTNPPPLVPLAGASDREGRTRRNRHHWIQAPSRGIIPIFLFLYLDHRGINAAPQGFNIVPFSGSLYSTAMQHGSRPTMGAIGGMRECCYDGPRCR